MEYFTSDLHFYHEKLLPFRGFATSDEMNKEIIDSINRTCTKEDTLYILGDISFGKKGSRTNELMESISPDIIVVKGNHDHREKNGKLKFHHLLKEFHDNLVRGFDVGGDTMQMVHMFHYPLAHWYIQHTGTWHLHGHLHGSPSLIPGKIMDVGWDIYRRPISIMEIKEYMDKQPVRANHHSGRFFP